jgi:toxin FitB
MIVLDTNVISEAMKPAPHPAVHTWLNAQPPETLYVSTVTIAELLFGLATLPVGKRKNTLVRALDGFLKLFNGRILVFDLDASQSYAKLMAKARAAGSAISETDGFIAAIAAANRMMVATRDTAPFEAAALSVINPWKS